MPNAQIVSSYTDASLACMAVRVNEGAPLGQVEYVGRVPLPDDWATLTNPQKVSWVTANKPLLVAAAKAERDRSIRSVSSDLGLSGVVVV